MTPCEALALWPKGDAWHGGGLFRDAQTIFLNHRPDSAAPHPAHVPPKQVRVIDNPQAHGENEPIYTMRLDRDGWRLDQQWQVSWNGHPIYFRTEQPDIRTRRQPRGRCQLRMVRSITGFHYRETFTVETLSGTCILELPPDAWANWDRRGRLVVLHEGKVLVGREAVAGRSFELRELVDLNDRRPEALISPAWARKW
ncbi:hypothetical protein F8S13_18620 [Chloroflexia bacterium SDU3-3]|nr:hypothetical protein F8S13_18620 [Chloroflexia bacterium SDU3-3]